MITDDGADTVLSCSRDAAIFTRKLHQDCSTLAELALKPSYKLKDKAMPFAALLVNQSKPRSRLTCTQNLATKVKKLHTHSVAAGGCSVWDLPSALSDPACSGNG